LLYGKDAETECAHFVFLPPKPSPLQTKSVKDLARLSLDAPEYLSVHSDAAVPTPLKLTQAYMVVSLGQKMDVLWGFIKCHLTAKTIVFLSTCKQVRSDAAIFVGCDTVRIPFCSLSTSPQLRQLDTGGGVGLLVRAIHSRGVGLHVCVVSASPLVKNRGSCLCAVLVYDGGDTKGARSPGVGRNHMH
jgi:hypothetical protein